MPIKDILAEIDSQIAALQKAKTLLSGVDGQKTHTKNKAASPAQAKLRKKPRISAEGRAHIAEAQRKRWAALKKKD